MNELLASLGSTVLSRAVPLTITTAALLAAAVLLDRLLSRRTRASLRILFYAPIALHVLLPRMLAPRIAGAPDVDALALPLARIAGGTADAPSSWPAIVGAIYLAVAVLLAARAVRAHVLLARAVAAAEPAPDLGADAPACPVVVHDELGPLVSGLVAPRIVLPRRMVDPELSALGVDEPLRCVLRHEAAHVHRRDAWLSAAMTLFAVVLWPVPPIWFAIGRVRRLIELACDEAAVADRAPAERRRYAHVLLDLAERADTTIAPLSPALHFGAGLRARIEALASAPSWPRAAQMIVAIAAPLALFAACSAAPASPGNDASGYGYEFSDDSQKEAAAASSSTPPPAPANGRLPPERIQSVVRASFPSFKQCYEAGLARDPKLAGTVTVRFTINLSGLVEGAANDGSSLPDQAVVACIVGAFGKLAFEKPNGGIVTVVYPIVFSP
jgi:hypothetical protein